MKNMINCTVDTCRVQCTLYIIIYVYYIYVEYIYMNIIYIYIYIYIYVTNIIRIIIYLNRNSIYRTKVDEDEFTQS